MGPPRAWGVQSVAADLGIPGTLTLRADAQAAIGICRRSGIGRVRHLAVGQLWIQERIRDRTIALEKVAGESNPADAATKHLCAESLRKCYAALGCETRAGRSGAAPALAADVEPFLQESGGRREGPTRPLPGQTQLPGVNWVTRPPRQPTAGQGASPPRGPAPSPAASRGTRPRAPPSRLLPARAPPARAPTVTRT